MTPQFLAIIPFVALLLVPVVLWLPRHLLRVTERLERSSAEMRRLYEVAREASLRDALTGLGNHRAFQEELDRQLDCYNRYRVKVALLLSAAIS